MTLPALLFQTHVWNAIVARRFRRWEEETQGLAECHLLLQADAPLGPPLPQRTHRFDPSKLSSDLGIPTLIPGSLVPGSAHLPLLAFAQTHAHPHYWLVEYDVEFTGHWAQVLAWGDQSDADLLGAHLSPYETCPDWYWWRTLRLPENRMSCWKLFLPLFRMSAAGVKALMDCYHKGWTGHAEAILPTALVHAGLKVQDLGAIAPAWHPGSIEPWGTPLSSHRWRPEVTLEECQATFQPDCIYHPVKGLWTFQDGAFWQTNAPQQG